MNGYGFSQRYQACIVPPYAGAPATAHLTLPIAARWVPSLSPASGGEGNTVRPPLSLSAPGGGEGRGEVGDRRKLIPSGTRRLARRNARAARAGGHARLPR